MGFSRDKDESALNRIVSQIDGGICREELISQKISPHDVLYRRYHQMRETQAHHFSDQFQQEEQLSEGYKPLKKRVPLEERASSNLFESGKGDPLAAPLAGVQSLKKRLPESLHEMRTRLQADDVEDPSVSIAEEARLEAELLARRKHRQTRDQSMDDDSNLNESFEERPKLRKPLNLDMPIANREGMRVSETVSEPSPSHRILPSKRKKIRESVDAPFEETSVGRAEADLSGYLRNLGSKMNTKDPVEESDSDIRTPTREEAYREEQQIRNKYFTEGVKPKEIPEQAAKPRRRVGSNQITTPSAVREGEDPGVTATVEETFKKISKRLAENTPQGIKLFEDILHDYVSLAYVQQQEFVMNPEEV